MVSAALARNVFGIIGNVISLCLYLSPAPKFYEIIKKKEVEEEELAQAMLMSGVVWCCGLWVFYGMPFVHPHSILVVTINSVGLLIHLIYFTIFCIYAAKGRLVLFCFLIEGIVFACVVLSIMLTYHSPHERSTYFGLISLDFIFLPLASQIMIIEEVKNKSVSLWFSLANFFNAVCWTTYALIHPLDPFIIFFNLPGVILGLVQLKRNASIKKEETQVHPVDVEALELQPVPN